MDRYDVMWRVVPLGVTSDRCREVRVVRSLRIPIKKSNGTA